MGEQGNCAADGVCCTSVGHSCGLATEINEVRPGPRDAATSIEDCDARVTSLYLSAALYVDSIIAYVLARRIYAWQAGRRDVQRTEEREERKGRKEKRISKL